MEKAVVLCLLFILSSFFAINFVVGESNGLTIKLIHSASSESPFYEPNLTYIQQNERVINQSEARFKFLSDMPSDLRSRVVVESNSIFLTHMGIGTFRSTSEPFKTYYLAVDVGSSLTWLECQDCKRRENHCFRPTSQPFPDAASSSYEKLLCPTGGHPNPLCDPRECIGKYCGYNLKYCDNSTSKGFLASETFSFDSITGTHMTEKVSNLVFGCGFDIRNMRPPHTSRISGILGLGWGARSFVTQLGPKSNGKFSYCLQRNSPQNISTFLQFGDHIPITRAIHSTPLINYGLGIYFVNLTGMSVSGTHISVTEQDFGRKPNNTGGCILDSGSTITHIVNSAYVKLKERLIEHFGHVHSFKRVQLPKYDLCYKRRGSRKGFRDLPTITFHFQGADLNLEPQNVFVEHSVSGKENFCLSMLPNNGADRFTLIGAYQQINFRFVYSTRDRRVHFGPENCSANA